MCGGGGGGGKCGRGGDFPYSLWLTECPQLSNHVTSGVANGRQGGGGGGGGEGREGGGAESIQCMQTV